MKNKKKITMKHRLQIRFVLISAAALLLLQGTIAAFSIYRNYQQLTIKADKIIHMININPEAEEIGDAKYFSVKYDTNSHTAVVDLTHTSLVRRNVALQYAKVAMDSGRDKGFVEGYRYHLRRGEEGIHILFLARNVGMEAFRDNARVLLTVSLAGFVIMSCVLAAVSGVVVKPIVESRQKQNEFITSASHELKTPLTVINADAQLLQSEVGDSEWIDDIRKQVDFLTQMTNSLVFLARSEEQEARSVKIDFPISDIAEDVLQSYKSIPQSRSLQFDCSIQPGITYHGDEKAIRELLNILLDNAFKYCLPNGRVSVTLRKEARGVCLAVRNTTEYIDKAQINSFTNRFYRGSSAGKVKGFGLGLSIADVIVKNHRGKLSIDASGEHEICVSVLLK